jgi:hypothetical protein
MLRIRASWVVLAAVGILVAAVPALREAVRVQWWALTVPTGPAAHAEAADRLVTAHYPNDSDMLLAAGSLIWDDGHLADLDGPTPLGARLKARGGALLKQAIRAGAGPPAYAAYAATRLRDLDYLRPGTYWNRFDPRDPKDVEHVHAFMRTSGKPDRIAADRAAAALAALDAWEAADPGNGMPVVLKAYVLYGVHRDAEALQCIRQGAHMPAVSSRDEPLVRARLALYRRMGWPDLNAGGDASLGGTYLIAMSVQRIGRYEGYVAKLDGRPADAVALWNAIVDFGHHMAEQSYTIVDFVSGASIETEGADPVWRYVDERSFDVPTDVWLQPRKGHLVYGPEHSFYLVQLGGDADNALRDRLLQTEARLRLVQARWLHIPDLSGWDLQSSLVQLATPIAAVAVLLLAAFVPVSLRGRRHADGATTVSRGWKLAFCTPLLLAAVFMRAVAAGEYRTTAWLAAVIAGFTLLLATLVALTRLAVRFTRRNAARTRDVWRGNLRSAIPVAAALCAVLYATSSLWCVHIRQHIAGKLTRVSMPDIRKQLGPSWTHPTIPPDSWRAEYPRKLPQGRGGWRRG